MFHDLFTKSLLSFHPEPAFSVWGRGLRETDWHLIHVLATDRRNHDGRLPLFRGCCITWTRSVIAVGWDFAEWLIREQVESPCSREHPQVVLGGCLRYRSEGVPTLPSASEIMAHECGHTAQARQMAGWYWPFGGTFTLFLEGPRPWNRFENQASNYGAFGGIVTGSVCPRLRPLLRGGD